MLNITHCLSATITDRSYIQKSRTLGGLGRVAEGVVATQHFLKPDYAGLFYQDPLIP